MPQPYNYSPLNYINPTVQATQGLSQGLALGLQGKQLGLQQQQINMTREEVAAQRERELRALAQRKMWLQDMAYLYRGGRRPTAREIAYSMTQYPEMTDKLRKAWDTQEEGRKQETLSSLSQVRAVLNSGNKDLAVQMLTDQANELRSSGDENAAKVREAIAKAAEVDTKLAEPLIDPPLIAALGPERFAAAYGKQGEERRAAKRDAAEQRKAEAEASQEESEARIKEIDARYADSRAFQQMKRDEWDIRKIINDINISKENLAISRINSRLAREDNDIRRQMLQERLDTARFNREEKIAKRQEEIGRQARPLEQALGVFKELADNRSAVSAAVGKSGTVGQISETAQAIFQPEAYWAEGKIRQLENILAASKFKDLTGPKSDRDIILLKNIASSLRRLQDEDRFFAELDRAREVTERLAQQLSDRTGAKIRNPFNEKPSPGIPATMDRHGNISLQQATQRRTTKMLFDPSSGRLVPLQNSSTGQ